MIINALFAIVLSVTHIYSSYAHFVSNYTIYYSDLAFTLLSVHKYIDFFLFKKSLKDR